MYECLICRENKKNTDKVELSCSHHLCKNCLNEWKKRSETCPFCRSKFKINPWINPGNPEEWMFLDPAEWVVYSRTDMRKGEEKIYIFKKDEKQPSWRNDDITIKLKKTKRVRKIIRNKQLD